MLLFGYLSRTNMANLIYTNQVVCKHSIDVKTKPAIYRQLLVIGINNLLFKAVV